MAGVYIMDFWSMDWRSLLVIAGGIIVLLATNHWWLPPLLAVLQGKQIKATWADKHYDLSVEKLGDATVPASLVSSQISSTSYRVAVVNISATVKDAEIKAAVAALQKQVHRDFAPAWGIDAELTFVPKGAEPAADSWRMLILDDSDQTGALGYRDLTNDGFPQVKIFVRSSQQAGASWTVSASHVLLELLANPRQDLTVFVEFGDKSGRLFAHEVCNPCSSEQYAYEIDGVLVSDFVFPAWFERNRKPRSTRFDCRNHISEPLMILPRGYAPILDVRSSSGWKPIFASEKPLRIGRKSSTKK